MHFAFRMTAGTEGAEFPFAPTIQNSFRHDAPRAIAGADEKDIINSVCHSDARELCLCFGATSRRTAGRDFCNNGSGGLRRCVAAVLGYLAEGAKRLPRD